MLPFLFFFLYFRYSTHQIHSHSFRILRWANWLVTSFFLSFCVAMKAIQFTQLHCHISFLSFVWLTTCFFIRPGTVAGFILTSAVLPARHSSLWTRNPGWLIRDSSLQVLPFNFTTSFKFLNLKNLKYYIWISNRIKMRCENQFGRVFIYSLWHFTQYGLHQIMIWKIF